MRRAKAGPIAVAVLVGYNDLTDGILSLLA
jgi:hypothetical protein